MFKTKRTLWVIETQTRHVCLLWTGYDVFFLVFSSDFRDYFFR